MRGATDVFMVWRFSIWFEPDHCGRSIIEYNLIFENRNGAAQHAPTHPPNKVPEVRAGVGKNYRMALVAGQDHPNSIKKYGQLQGGFHRRSLTVLLHLSPVHSSMRTSSNTLPKDVIDIQFPIHIIVSSQLHLLKLISCSGVPRMRSGILRVTI